MSHPLLLAGGAAAIAALVFGGSKTAHAAPRLPANNGGGLQPPPPSGGLFGPTAQPASDSGLAPGPSGSDDGSLTGADGNSYQEDGSGGVLFPDTDGSASASASTPGPVANDPSETGDQGTFENTDDTASAPASTDDSGSEDSSSLFSDASSGDATLPASVSGALVGMYVGGPPGALVGAVLGGLMGPHVSGPLPYRSGRKNPTAGKGPKGPILHNGHHAHAAQRVGGRVGDTLYTDTSGITEPQDTQLQVAAARVNKAQRNLSAANRNAITMKTKYGVNSQQYQKAVNLVRHYQAGLAYANRQQATVQATVAQNEGPTPLAVGAPLGDPYDRTPSGLVYSRHVQGWTHPYPGHEYGAPPPAGLPVY